MSGSRGDEGARRELRIFRIASVVGMVGLTGVVLALWLYPWRVNQEPDMVDLFDALLAVQPESSGGDDGVSAESGNGPVVAKSARLLELSSGRRDRTVGSPDSGPGLVEVLDAGLAQYMALDEVQQLIGLETVAAMLVCCDIMAVEPGIEIQFFNYAAGVLSRPHLKEEWADRLFAAMSRVEAARGRFKQSQGDLNLIKDNYVKGEAAYDLAMQMAANGNWNRFHRLKESWLDLAETAPPEQGVWIRFGVAQALVEVGRVEEGEELAAEVLAGPLPPRRQELEEYNSGLALARAMRGMATEALNLSRETRDLDMRVLVGLIIEHTDPGKAAEALHVALVREASAQWASERRVFELAEGLARLGRNETALAVPVVRPQTREVIALGVLHGVAHVAGPAEALRFAASPEGPDFDAIREMPVRFARNKAIAVLAELVLLSVEAAGSEPSSLPGGAGADRAMARLERIASEPDARLTLMEVYAAAGHWDRALKLSESLSAADVRRVHSRVGGLAWVARPVLNQPAGLSRGVLLLQMAAAEIRRRSRDGVDVAALSRSGGRGCSVDPCLPGFGR